LPCRNLAAKYFPRVRSPSAICEDLDSTVTSLL